MLPAASALVQAEPSTVKLVIDGREVETEVRSTVLHAARKLGIDLARFRFWQNGVDLPAETPSTSREELVRVHLVEVDAGLVRNALFKAAELVRKYLEK